MRFPPVDIDFEAGVMRVQTTRGLREEPLPSAFLETGTSFRGMTVDVDADRLVVRLPNDVDAVVELGVTGGESHDHLGGRQVVYLDQNRWSTLANWRHGHRPVAAAEGEAAERLAELVHDERVVLPMSVGHMIETGRLYDVPRVALASTMLELSRGWQLRNPIEVRAEELAAAIEGVPPVASGIVSLDADVLFGERLGVPDGSDLPDPMGAALGRLTNVSSTYEVLIGSDQVPDRGGRAAAADWASKFEDFGRWLESAGTSREQALRAAAAMVLDDLLPEIARLAPEEAVESWLREADERDLAPMPYLSRDLAVIFGRLRQPGTRWTGNDLIDLSYLCSAAGYADVVVGERRTIGELRTAKRVPPGAALATTLVEAIDLIEHAVGSA